MTNRPICGGIAAILLVLSPAAGSQVKSVEILWSGLFRPFTTPPSPGEPNIKLSYFYIGPRPVGQPDRVPGRVGVIFGVLFVPRGAGPTVIKLRKVNHFPEPGLVDSTTVKPAMSSEDSFDCIGNKPCFAGYRFDEQREVIPGKWRMEIFLGDTKLLENQYIVEGDAGRSSSAALAAKPSDSTFERPEYRITLPGPWTDDSRQGLNSYRSMNARQGLTTISFLADRPWTQGELDGILRKMAQARVEAARRAYGPEAAFEAPEFSTSGKFSYVRVWGVVPGETQIGSLMVGDSSGVQSFTYVSQNMDVPAFRAEAERIFESIHLK